MCTISEGIFSVKAGRIRARCRNETDLPATALAALTAGCLLSSIRCDSTGGGGPAATPSKPAKVTARVSPEVLAKLDARMAAIPAGQAKSVSRGGKPVAIAAFLLGKYEVTRGEWNAVMGGRPPSPGDEDLPVTGVSLLDVRQFLDRLNDAAGAAVYRLPTRREWEYSCHAGRSGKYPWGNDAGAISRHAWWGKNSDEHAHKVGGKPANAWGLFDMIGNVDEWTSDAMRPGMTYIEGGNFDEPNDSCVLCENESAMGGDVGNEYTGFRLARNAKGPASR